MFQLSPAAAPIGSGPDVSQAAAVPATLPSDAFGAVEDEDHIVVLGGRGPELMCALLRAGATNVTHLRADERPEAASASPVGYQAVGMNPTRWLLPRCATSIAAIELLSALAT